MDYTKTELQKIFDKKIAHQAEITSQIINCINSSFDEKSTQENVDFFTNCQDSGSCDINAVPHSTPIETILVQTQELFRVFVSVLEDMEQTPQDVLVHEVLKYSSCCEVTLEMLREDIKKLRQYCARNEIDF